MVRFCPSIGIRIPWNLWITELQARDVYAKNKNREGGTAQNAHGSLSMSFKSKLHVSEIALDISIMCSKIKTDETTQEW